MRKTILCVAATLFGAAFGANAANLAVDSWTNDAGAWQSANQPFFASEHRILANDRSGQGEDRYGALQSSDGPSWLIHHLTGHSFYAGLSPVDFVLTPKEAVAGTTVVRLSVLLNFGFHEKPTLTVTGVNGGTLALTSEVVEPSNAYLGDINNPDLNDPLPNVTDEPLELYIFSWTLDHPLGAEDTFYLNFGINRHASLSSVILLQEAVPEPSTYALIAAACGLAAVVVGRRRRKA